MNPNPTGMNEAATRFKAAAREMLSAYAARKPTVSDQVAPPQLVEALEQFLAITINLDKEEGEVGPILKDDVTQLGEYGLSLVADLTTWAGQLRLEGVQRELEKTAIAIADWVVRHEGQLGTLEPVVNALARMANGVQDPKALEQLAGFMTRLLHAAAAVIKQDLEKTNPGRPWRVLHLNRGIVATRSHNTALMEQVFDELIGALPEDAAMFFQQGMQQMEALNYPPQVRQVMDRYYNALTRHSVH